MAPILLLACFISYLIILFNSGPVHFTMPKNLLSIACAMMRACHNISNICSLSIIALKKDKNCTKNCALIIAYTTLNTTFKQRNIMEKRAVLGGVRKVLKKKKNCAKNCTCSRSYWAQHNQEHPPDHTYAQVFFHKFFFLMCARARTS